MGMEGQRVLSLIDGHRTQYQMHVNDNIQEKNLIIKSPNKDFLNEVILAKLSLIIG